MIAERALWIECLNTTLPGIHEQYAAVDGVIALHYTPHVTDAEHFRVALEERQEEEIIRGVTVVGPQRDNITASLDGNDLQHYGSQGQHRSVVISLKIAEVQLAKRQTGRTPILLLDDVASELDPTRLAAFFTALQDQTCQIILTTVHVGDIMDNTAHGSSTLAVCEGVLS